MRVARLRRQGVRSSGAHQVDPFKNTRILLACMKYTAFRKRALSANPGDSDPPPSPYQLELPPYPAPQLTVVPPSPRPPSPLAISPAPPATVQREGPWTEEETDQLAAAILVLGRGSARRVPTRTAIQIKVKMTTAALRRAVDRLSERAASASTVADQCRRSDVRRPLMQYTITTFWDRWDTI